MTPEHHAQQLIERGYTVVERSHGEADVESFRERLLRIYTEQGSPPPYAEPARELTSELLVNPTGFVLFKLLAFAPDLASRLLSPRVVDAARALLGADMRLELTGAVISDGTRPFFSWHNHIGGIDVEEYRARRVFPRFQRSQRVIAVLYLDDIDPDGGEILVLPRRITDPTEPLGDERAPHWDGQVSLSFPRGSTMILEQCTWHAVRPQRRAGLRMFVGCYFRSAEAPPTDAVDDSLLGFTGGGELLQSVLP